MTKLILLRFSDIKTFDDAVKQIKINRTEFTAEAEKRINKVADILEKKVSIPMIQELRQYPAVRDRTTKVRWKSEKQRRYVMMKASKGEIRLPYVRTGRLADSWKTSVTVTFGRQDKVGLLKFEVWNEWPDSQFVIGKIGQGSSTTSLKRYEKPIQPFHSITGWSPAHRIISKYFKIARDIVKIELTDWKMSQS